MTIDAQTEQLLRRRLAELADQVDEPTAPMAFAPEVAPRRRSSRTVAFAVALASVAAVVATVLAVSGDRPREQSASMLESSDEPPLSPTRLPADLQLEIAESYWQPVQATRVQRYISEDDPAVTVGLAVTAFPSPVAGRAAQSDVPMLGQMIDPAAMSWEPAADGGRLSAIAAGGFLSLSVVGLDETGARDIAAKLVARSSDPLDGYDPAPNSGLRLAADVLQDAGRAPVTSQEWRSQGTGRTLSITTTVATPATEQLIGLVSDIQSESIIGGRKVMRSPSGATFRDGDSIVSISDSNLTDAEIDAVIDALEPLSPAEWARRRQAANDRLAGATLLAVGTAPTSNGPGRNVTVELRQLEVPVFCLSDGDTRSCARFLFGTNASAASGPDASDAASFGTLRYHNEVWILGTVGPDINDNVKVELGDNTVEPAASTDPDGRRWYAWKIDNDHLEDGLPFVYLDGPLAGGAGHLALPR